MAAEIKRDEALKIVRDALSDILEIEPDTISEGQSFADDLEADSLALIELVEALEGLPSRSGGSELRASRQRQRAPGAAAVPHPERQRRDRARAG